MGSQGQHRIWIFGTSLRAAAVALAMAIVFALTVFVTRSAQAQTYTVLHNFSRGPDGGNLYGTVNSGGAGYGTVFKLAHRGSGWIFSPLYTFTGGGDGGGPAERKRRRNPERRPDL